MPRKKRWCMKCHWLLCLGYRGWAFWVGERIFCIGVLGIGILSLVFSPKKQSGHAIRLWPWLNSLIGPNGLGEQQPFRPTFGLAQKIFLQIKPQHAKITHEVCVVWTAMYKATKHIKTVPTVELRDLELKLKTCNAYQRPLQKMKWLHI